jgi:hypothetical protein
MVAYCFYLTSIETSMLPAPAGVAWPWLLFSGDKESIIDQSNEGRPAHLLDGLFR